MLDTARLSGLVADVLPLVVETRRAIHRSPELSGEEYRTTERLAEILRSRGLEPRVRTPKTGLLLDLGTDGPMVAFRADLDALPIDEPRGLAFASETPGVMHACGHDAHAAIGLGVALVLSRLDLPGRVRIVFQPAEETFPGGAYELVRERVLEGVRAIVAFHVDPGLETGRVGLKDGAITSSADRFTITLEGPGGHTARPHATVDLVHAAGLVVSQLPALVDRLVDARAPVALVFGTIRGGRAHNVIPTQVEMQGTLRTADRRLWEEVPAMFERLVHALVAPTGATATVHYQRGLPPVVNDPELVRSIGSALVAAAGPDAVGPTYVSMGAEDFARYLEEVPGALLRLGCRAGEGMDLHSASFQLDEDCLETGTLFGSLAVLKLLGADGV